MPIFDTAGDLITSIALTVVTVAVFFYLLHWTIRSAITRALGRHDRAVRDFENLPTGSALPSGKAAQPPYQG
jgi:hypothetical protein